ncbi:MAG: glycosyltransferase family 39 protein, partial [Armatimonadetes bacterium]|nr:glycosyltransferase family 39 protein [Armatimonadota bacterium]
MAREKKSERIIREPQAARGIMSDKTAEYLCVGIILVTASVLILANLGNIYLWGDEAQNALLAKTTLTHGIPLAYDGTNYFSNEPHECTENYIWIWQPWFPYYLLAGFFAVFGTSTFTARLPFALAGIGTILLTYYYGKSLWHSRRAALMAALLLMLSVPFLLLVRQCRYYSLTAFFSLAGLYAYSEMLNGRKRAPVVFGLSALLLFHTHYTYTAALLGTAIIHSLIFRRDRLKSVLIVSAIVTALCVPWVFLFGGMGRVVSEYHDKANRTISMLKSFVVQLGTYVFPPWLLALPAFAAWYRFRREKQPSADSEVMRNVVLMLLFCVLTLAAVSATGLQDYFRYLAPLIPVLILVAALILDSSMRVHPAIGIVVFALLVCRGQMPDYLYEITHDYNGPSKGIAKYLNENGHPNDVVAVSHEPLPLMFYTNMRIINGTSGEDYSPARNAKWIILRQEGLEADAPFVDYLNANVPGEKYELITLD